MFKDKENVVIYVGKAIDLYSRVASYFRRKELAHFSTRHLEPKMQLLTEKIASVDTVIVESELEALILEANLIKKFLPLYNIRLADDKDYLYIRITKEPFPKIITARKNDLEGALKYFGPFPSSRTVRDTLKLLRRVFPWCSNPPRFLDSHHTVAETRLRPCFYYHLHLCPGACVGKINQKDYRKIVNRFIAFMEGKKSQLVKELTDGMMKAAEKEKFEEAQALKKMLSGVVYLTQSNRVQAYLENPNFLEDEKDRALKELQKDLRLPTLPSRIEAYDISNIQGGDATGSMVVLSHGEIDKSQYRKFKIKISGKSDDYGMHKEILQRRLNHPDWPLPNLILIDGGRGQAKVARFVFKSRGLNIPVFGLAKRMEWLYPPEGEIVKLPRSNLSLKLLQKIRDEAHRFALSFHHKLRTRRVFDTP